MKRMAVLAAAMMAAASLGAALEPACLFSDHMVLQRGKPIPIWGEATAGNAIEVKFAGVSGETTVGADGKWRVNLPSMEANADGCELTITESEPGWFGSTVDERVFKDVLVGEVWLCGGQSNMTFMMWPVNSIGEHASREQNGYYDLALTDEPFIRGVHIPNRWTTAETNCAPQKWFRFIPGEDDNNFSAAAWHFAMRLRQALKIPIGVIESAWGGSNIETWIPAAAWAETEHFKANATAPITPKEKGGKYWQPRCCWNAMVYPLAPYAVRGMIWHQGCSNRGRWQSYYEMLGALRTGWGRAFECGDDMPFFLCQISPYGKSDNGSCEIREEMLRFALDHGHNVGCVSLSDVGELDCIHPRDKRTVGTRLAAMALNRIYGRTDLKCDAPVLKSAKLMGGNKIRLEFANCTGWNRSRSEQPSFEVAGADGEWVLPARVDYNTKEPFIWIACPSNMVPAKVAYMRKFTMHGLIKNEAGLPIGPFRAQVTTSEGGGKHSTVAPVVPKDMPRKALKLLTIGNSFSVSLVHELPKVAKDMGVNLEYGSAQIGGCPLERHWVNFSGVPTKGVPQTSLYQFSHFRDGVSIKETPKSLKEAITLEKWDIISIQQVSSLSWRPETYHPWADDLIKGIRELAPQAEIVIQETWSYTPWHGMWGQTPEQMYANAHAAYRQLSEKYGFRVVPMGTAVQNWRKTLPVKYAENSFGGDLVSARGFELKPEKAFVRNAQTGKWELYRGVKDATTGKLKGGVDIIHLNRRGEYFQALVWTAKLFGVDVTKAKYKPAYVTDDDAVLMRKVVMDTITR